MDDNSELSLKTICCTCLSRDRKLFQLCRVKEGVNCLYYLISYNPEAYMECFYKDPTILHICWECKAVMFKILQFREQVCEAQRKLNVIADGIDDVKFYPTLSRLVQYNVIEVNVEYTSDNDIDNFMDCGPTTDKSESDDDIPLSKFSGPDDKKNIPILCEESKTFDSKSIKKEQPMKIKKEKQLLKEGLDIKEYYTIDSMKEDEIKKLRLQIKQAPEFMNNKFKCESCIKTFNNKLKLDSHNRIFHLEKPKHTKCDMCMSFIKNDLFFIHNSNHYNVFSCKMCKTTCLTLDDLLKHLQCEHGIQTKLIKSKKPKERKTESGYPCTKCNKCFRTYQSRWSHIQQHHTEGVTCEICGKRLPCNSSLKKHQLTHIETPPRKECNICHKMVREDLFKTHVKIHKDRESFKCIQCDKVYVNRSSYEHHLKYSAAHNKENVLLRHKCPLCDRRYRSQREMNDHCNYHHLGKTEHQCPICGKALATKRCIARHIKRTHQGITEGKRDKVCQQCGKAFRDKKNLREHVLIHTGSRPLSCETCGCTFRQTASLYTHRKRVHHICTDSKTVDVIS